MEEASLSFEDFSIEMQDFKLKRSQKHNRVWHISEGGSICCIPLIHEGLLYFGCANHNIYCVDARTGELVWKYKTSGIVLESSPVHWNGIIFSGSFDKNMYALDAKTGKPVWKFRTQGPIDGGPFIDKDRLYFASRDRIVYCVDAGTGKLIWKYETNGEIVSNVTVVNGRLFVGSYDKYFYCIDADNGKLVWRFQTQGEFHMMNPTLVHKGVVFVSSFDSNIYAIDEKDGTLIWKHTSGQYGNSHSPVLYRDTVYNSSRDGFLYALSLDGKLKWKFVRREPLCIPAFHNDRIYVGCEDQFMYCLDMEGKELWKFKTEGVIWLQAVIWEDRLYFPSWDCHIYVLDIKTHKLVWKFRTDGSPSYLPPPHIAFEMVMKTDNIITKDTDFKKKYDINITDDDHDSKFYKSRITYQVSTQYSAKGKYQKDADEEAL